mmetsp:Transcript_104581/g.294698  ORF Transcript_104581/g.294698 Transcript_104581/m.294698 type:complete len:204 (-) Transcript_104581:572-1183(-)
MLELASLHGRLLELAPPPLAAVPRRRDQTAALQAPMPLAPLLSSTALLLASPAASSGASRHPRVSKRRRCVACAAVASEAAADSNLHKWRRPQDSPCATMVRPVHMESPTWAGAASAEDLATTPANWTTWKVSASGGQLRRPAMRPSRRGEAPCGGKPTHAHRRTSRRCGRSGRRSPPPHMRGAAERRAQTSGGRKCRPRRRV